MGEVTRLRKKHWVGADADLASIPDSEIGDTYLATDKNKLYYKTAGGWKTGLGYEYVIRLVGAVDWNIGDFTIDGNAHVDGLDASGIVPAGAISAHLSLSVKASSANKVFQLYKNAVDTLNSLTNRTQVAAIYFPPVHGLVACDADRLFDYLGQIDIDAIELTVLGWFI